MGLSAVNDRTLATVGLNKLKQMHKELLPAAQYEQNLRRVSANNNDNSNTTKTKYRANNKNKSTDKQALTPELEKSKTDKKK